MLSPHHPKPTLHIGDNMLRPEHIKISTNSRVPAMSGVLIEIVATATCEARTHIDESRARRGIGYMEEAERRAKRDLWNCIYGGIAESAERIRCRVESANADVEWAERTGDTVAMGTAAAKLAEASKLLRELLDRLEPSEFQ